MRRTFLAVLAISLLSTSPWGCGRRPEKADENAELRGLVLPPVLADTSLIYLETDSSAVGIGDYDRAHKVKGRENYWLVDYHWFFLPKRPLEFKTFAEMHALEQKGDIDSATVVSTISYRLGMEAFGVEEIRKRAIELRPKVPPSALAAVVEDYVAKHRVTKKD